MSETEKNRRETQSNNAIKQNYRPKEAAEYLAIGLSTVWLYIRQSKLKAYKLSDRVTILKKEDLDNFVKSQCEVAS